MKQHIRANILGVSFACSLLAGFALFAVSGDTAEARGSGAAARSGTLARSSVSTANRSVSTSQRNRVNTGDVNRTNINTGNVRVGNDVNVDIDVDNDWGHHRIYDHPIAAGIAIGAVAVTTAAIVGSYYYALPPSGCTVVIKNGISYHYCGSVYYQQTWYGSDVVYVVVNP